MRTPGKDIFFIGFLNEWPVGLKTFLPVVGVVFLCLFAGLGFAISAAGQHQNMPFWQPLGPFGDPKRRVRFGMDHAH